jgi:hypothetical protein
MVECLEVKGMKLMKIDEDVDKQDGRDKHNVVAELTIGRQIAIPEFCIG